MMKSLNHKLFAAISILIFYLNVLSCVSKTHTTDTWDSTRKNKIPGDSTFNKIDTSSSAHLVDTDKMMTDTSNR